MFESTGQVAPAWVSISRLGSASLCLPVFFVTAWGLWRCQQKEALRRWLAACLAAIALTLASKILFFGWGIGIAVLDFTGISGHALLSASILPVLGGFLARHRGAAFSRAGALAGLLLAAVVAVSRVMLSAHSVSEVIIAWLLGAAMVIFVAGAARPVSASSRLLALAACLLLGVFSPTVSGYLPSHQWEIRIALFLSGHERHFERHDLHSLLPAWPRGGGNTKPAGG
jgi:membrane-associated phospholipid phosphatase